MLWRILSIPEHTANKCEGHMLGEPKFTNSDFFPASQTICFHARWISGAISEVQFSTHGDPAKMPWKQVHTVYRWTFANYPVLGFLLASQTGLRQMLETWRQGVLPEGHSNNSSISRFWKVNLLCASCEFRAWQVSLSTCQRQDHGGFSPWPGSWLRRQCLSKFSHIFEWKAIVWKNLQLVSKFVQTIWSGCEEMLMLPTHPPAQK